MSRVDLVGGSAQEIVCDEHLVPCVDEVDVDIVGHLQVTVHAQETCERAIDGVMERIAIQAVYRLIAEEVLVLVRCEVGSSEETRRKLRWCATTTTACRE